MVHRNFSPSCWSRHGQLASSTWLSPVGAEHQNINLRGTFRIEISMCWDYYVSFHGLLQVWISSNKAEMISLSQRRVWICPNIWMVVGSTHLWRIFLFDLQILSAHPSLYHLVGRVGSKCLVVQHKQGLSQDSGCKEMQGSGVELESSTLPTKDLEVKPKVLT